MKKIMVFMIAFLFFFPNVSSNISSNKKNQNAFQIANEFLNSDLQDILILSAKQIGINADKKYYYKDSSLKKALNDFVSFYGFKGKIPEINVSYNLQKSISSILYSMIYASILCNQAYKKIGKDEMNFILSRKAKEIFYKKIMGNGNKIKIGRQINKMSDTEKLQYIIKKFYEKGLINENEKEIMEKYVSIMKKIDMKKIVEAGEIVLDAIERQIPFLENSSYNYTIKFPPYIAIGGMGDDNYTNDYYFLIDFEEMILITTMLEALICIFQMGKKILEE